MEWGWRLGGPNNTANSAESSSGLDILSRLVTGRGNTPSYGMAAGGHGDGTVDGGGGVVNPTDPAQTGALPDPNAGPIQYQNQSSHPWLTNQGQQNPNIWMGGGGYSGQGGGDVGRDSGFPFAQWNTAAQAGITPNFGGATGPTNSGGGGGGGGYSASTLNGQKIIYNDRNKTWSLQDPKTKAWEDGIATGDIYGRLTGDLRNANPEWYYGQSASAANDSRQYELIRQTNQYGQMAGGSNQTSRYPTYGM